jgi:hypothetical protein
MGMKSNRMRLIDVQRDSKGFHRFYALELCFRFYRWVCSVSSQHRHSLYNIGIDSPFSISWSILMTLSTFICPLRIRM